MKRGKLIALRKTYEIEEQHALEEKNRIETIVEERRRIFEQLLGDQRDLSEQLQSLRMNERRKALHGGDGAGLAAITSHETRLQRALEEVSELCVEREKELEQALERVQLADQDLINVRIDMKKIEKFLDNQQHSERVSDAAKEEALADEMNFYRRRK